jgi:hypothetical protein
MYAHGPVRRLAVLLALVLVPAAAAATVKGSPGADLLVGTPAPDRITAGGGNDAIQAAFGGTDVVDCGAGVDTVSADQSDRLNNCEVVSRRISVDPYANADSQHETAVEPDSFAYGGTVVATFQVGRRRDGASANIGTAASTDGGRTWTRGFLPGLTVNSQPPGAQTAASDPTVAYDAAHAVWLVSALTIARNTSNVFVSRSTDGLHWSDPVDVANGPVLDKEWIACDNNAASTFRGRCYLEYTDDVKNIVVSQSSDDGGLTWSQPVRVTSILVGTQPVIQPNGTLVVVAGDYNGAKALTGSMVAVRSTDGGVTFTRSIVTDLRSRDNGVMRAIALPSVDIDSNGTIYAVWHDCRFRPGCTQNDLVLSTSTDGILWTPPTRVPVAPVSSSISAFISGLAADPAQPGRLGLVYAYYLAGTCERSCLLGIGFTTSPDGGRTWSASRKLHAQPMDLTWLSQAEGGRMVGDYFSTSYVNGRVVPVFALATSPLKGRFREAIFAASLPAAG